MQWFESKKAILEYCGKDWKDVRRLDRAIKDGKIGICDGAYYLVSEYVEHLENETWDLEEQVVALKKQLGSSWDGALRVVSHAMWEKVLDHGEINKLKEENADLRRHLAYVWDRLDHVNDCIAGMVQSYFNKNRQSMNFEEAEEKLYGIIKYKPDPNEKEERQFAIDQWALLE